MLAPISISLLEFLRTGELGPFHLGMHANEVEALVRGQERGSDLDGAAAYLWAFGSLELHFAEDRLFLIFCHPPVQGDEQLVVDPWILRKGLAPAELHAGLVATGIEHVVRPWPRDGQYDEVLTAAGVSLQFLREDEEFVGRRGLVAFDQVDPTRR